MQSRAVQLESRVRQLVPAAPIAEGAEIGVFSPSEYLTPKFRELVDNGAELLRKHGFRPKFAANYLACDDIRAGTADQRIADINELLDATGVQALMASWGGKACSHLIAKLPYESFLKQRKPMLGFSDITVLLNCLTAKTGVVTFHGPQNVARLDRTAWADLRCLFADFPWPEVNLLAGAAQLDQSAVLRRGLSSGRLFGGNLSCFVLGVILSRIDLSFFDGGIFFWEEVGLTPRQIDQLLTSLVNCGFMDRISGMVIGDFIAEESEEQRRSNPIDSVMNALSGFEFPIIYAPCFGHKQLENPIFPIGPVASLDTSAFSLRINDQILAAP